MTHVVYRMIGPCDCLLYVGVTIDFPERLRFHRGRSPFGTLIESWELEHYEDRAEAFAAERATIMAESPIFNVNHLWGAPPLITSGLGEMIHDLALEQGITPRELAAGIGVGYLRIRRMFMDPEGIRLPELFGIADLLGMKAGALLQKFEEQAA